VARWEVVDDALRRKNGKSDVQVVLLALSRPRCGQSNPRANLALGRGVWSPPTTSAAMRALPKPCWLEEEEDFGEERNRGLEV
jgi:hypothetical protein